MKSRSRRTSPKEDAAPPSTGQEGARRISAQMVELFDRRDGTGVDWPLVTESLFRAGFAALDRLDPEAQRGLAMRVHALAYDRYLAENGEGRGDTQAPSPAHVAHFNTAAPGPAPDR